MKTKHLRRPFEDSRQLLRVVVVKTASHRETRTERRRELALPRGGADEREFRQIKADGARSDALLQHDVDDEILHGGIKVFFNLHGEAVDFVNEKDVAFLQAGEKPREVAGLFDDRAGSRFDIGTYVVRDDIRERRLAESGRAAEEDVGQRFVAGFGGLRHDLEAFLDAILPGEIFKALWPQRCLERLFAGIQFRCDEAF